MSLRQTSSYYDPPRHASRVAGQPPRRAGRARANSSMGSTRARIAACATQARATATALLAAVTALTACVTRARIITVALVTALTACDTGRNASAPDFGPTITLTETGGTRPTTAIDPRDGTIYIAWIGAGQGTTDLYLTRIDPGQTVPASPVRVNHLPGDAAPHDQAPPRVAVGTEGNVYVAWQNNTVSPGRRFPTSNLRFARSTDRGRTFEPAIYINDDAETGPPASHTFHDMAVAHDGTIAVSWIDSRARATAQQNTKAQGADAAHSRHHQEHDDIGPEIRIAYSTDAGRSFLPNQLVDSGACPCCRTTIALARDGAAYIAWRKVLPGDIRDIVVARIDPNADPLETPHPIRPHPDDWHFEACPHAGPALLVDRAGTVHIAWYTGQADRAGLYYAASTDHGASFRNPTPILLGDAVPPSQVALAPAASGAISIAWEDRRGPERKVLAATLRQGHLAGKPFTLTGSAPALAYTHGTTALAWLDGDAVRVRIAR